MATPRLAIVTPSTGEQPTASAALIQAAQSLGFAGAAEVLPGLRDYYPELRSTSEIVIVRFEVAD